MRDRKAVEGGMSRRAFLGGSAAAAVAVKAMPTRDPAIVRSYGGLAVPASGCYWGADDTTRKFTAATGIETQLGRRMAIRNRRYNWLVACPSAAHTGGRRLTARR